MEEFRQIGEVLGSLRALMVLQDDIQINRRQCCLLFDVFSLAFDTIAEEIRLNLKLEEKNSKWNRLENPLKELQKIFKEGELYIKQCIDKKDWWVKAINVHMNKDSVDVHVHNLLSHFPSVIESIEMAGEIAGLNPDEMQRRKVTLARKYDAEWTDPKLFQFRYGKQYLIPREICSRFESAWREDRWSLVESLREKKSSVSVTKNQHRLASMLVRKIIGSEACNGKLFPSSILYGGDYQVRRRLGGQYKEILWLGDHFVMRNFFGDVVDPSCSELSTLLSLSHPNIMQCLCGFYDEDKKEVMLVLESVNKDLGSYMKEIYGSRRRIVFPLHVVVDLMFQIARGMEYLHSKKIYHGELSLGNIFVKSRNGNEGPFLLKVSGYGLSDVKPRTPPNSSPRTHEANPVIWYAPEVLLEQEQPGNRSSSEYKYSEKADVYSFGMLCFEILTGKPPFEGHVDKMSRHIMAGERPLFPHTTPKYLVNLTKRCWHTDPDQRLSFSSICRILRYVKKVLAMNPDHDQLETQLPIADYCEIESWFAKRFASKGSFNSLSVAQVPFQMFAYRLAEKDRTILSMKDKGVELTSEGASAARDDGISMTSTSDALLTSTSDTKSVGSDAKSCGSDTKSIYSDLRLVDNETPPRRTIRFLTPPKRQISTKIPEKKVAMTKKNTNTNVKAKKSPVAAHGQSTRPSTLNRVHSTGPTLNRVHSTGATLSRVLGAGVIRETRSRFVTSFLSRGRQRNRAEPNGHTSD